MRNLIISLTILLGIISLVAFKMQGGYLTHAQVVSTMTSIGANTTSVPTGWVAPVGFVNWNNLEFFQDENQIYAVYTWDAPSNADYISAEETCTHTWQNNGDCNGPASNCKIEVTNGETVIICCD